MKCDEAGRDFIKKFESLALKPYLDQHGIWTIGWGHIDGVTEDTPEINEDQAETFFEDDLDDRENQVTKLVTVYLTQNEFNALVSFTFNEGLGRLRTSTLLMKLNNGDKRGAAKEFDRWVYYRDKKTGEEKISNGLVARRAKEKALFSMDVLLSQAAVAV